jgi:hypothetical protein
VVREGVGAVGRNEPILYAHMNNKRKMKKKKRKKLFATHIPVKGLISLIHKDLQINRKVP